MVKTRFIACTLILAFLAGCDRLFFPIYFENTSSEPIEIEILRPADTAISPLIKKVLVFTKPDLVPIITILKGKGKFFSKLRLDTITGVEYHTMADLLSASPRYSIMEPVDSITNITKKYYNSGKDYNWDEIDSICLNADVDACLFLSKQNVIIGLDSKGYIGVTSLYEFYSPREHIAISKEVKTGVEFLAETDAYRDFMEALEDLKTLVSDYASENGEKFANWIAPVWQRDTRNYYTAGNRELESVKDLISKDKWDEVYSIWRKYRNSESMAVAKHACYNSILAYEMQGKLDSALLLARESYKRFKSEDIVNYGIILEERIRENDLVNRQLGLSNDSSQLKLDIN